MLPPRSLPASKFSVMLPVPASAFSQASVLTYQRSFSCSRKMAVARESVRSRSPEENRSVLSLFERSIPRYCIAIRSSLCSCQNRIFRVEGKEFAPRLSRRGISRNFRRKTFFLTVQHHSHPVEARITAALRRARRTLPEHRALYHFSALRLCHAVLFRLAGKEHRTPLINAPKELFAVCAAKVLFPGQNPRLDEVALALFAAEGENGALREAVRQVHAAGQFLRLRQENILLGKRL